MGAIPRAGEAFPDLELADHAGNPRAVSELVAGDPIVVQTCRGWWCPKDRAYLRHLVALQDELEVAYARIVSIGVDGPEVAAAFRAGLGARWTFLWDPQRRTEAPVAAAASAPAVGVAGRAAGHLAIWTTRARPTHGARRIDARLPSR